MDQSQAAKAQAARPGSPQAARPGSPQAAVPVAVTDIGSNSIRMVVAEVLPDGRIEPLERTQRAVHLGQDTFVSGRLSNPTMAAAIAVLKDCRRILDAYGVREARAVATSAVREAANADTFVERAYMACGLDVEIIEPTEESRLTVSAVQEALAAQPISPKSGAPDIDHRDALIDDRDALIADVGGGNALLTVLRGGQIAASESCRLGAIRLQETLSLAREPPARAARLIRQHIGGLLGVLAKSLGLAGMKTFIAVGGDARFAAAQVGRPAAGAGLRIVPLKAFDKLVAKCEQHTAEELAKRYALAHAEAETLVPALLVYQGLIACTAAEQLIVCDASMRDGLLLDLARAVTGREDEELANSILRSAQGIAEKYRCDAAHAAHVMELATRLFDELRGEHALGPRERLLLRVAALLHEAGGFVSGRAHHKHSYYLIANAEIFGLRREELQIVALVARYHRRSPPKPTHVEYMALPREKRMIASKLASLLRIADALDRSHGQQVRDLTLERKGSEWVLYIRGAPDLGLERRALADKGAMFEDLFGLKVRLEEATR